MLKTTFSPTSLSLFLDIKEGLPWPINYPSVEDCLPDGQSYLFVVVAGVAVASPSVNPVIVQARGK